jgi:hypothetical protein
MTNVGLNIYSLFTINKNGERNMNIEEIKDYSPKNLTEAKKQAKEDKASEEIQTARYYYEALIDKKETFERQLKINQENLIEINDKLKIFDKK